MFLDVRIIIATDHKPLLQILNDRSLTDITNQRLLNLKEKTLGYRFTLVHVPGRKNLGPNAALRHPAGFRNVYHYLVRHWIPTHKLIHLYLVVMPCQAYTSVQKTLLWLMKSPLFQLQLVHYMQFISSHVGQDP